jgi:hypothetical protein
LTNDGAKIEKKNERMKKRENENPKTEKLFPYEKELD